MREQITAPAVRTRKGGRKISMVTAYDAPTARIADRAGADIILVGDSVGNVVLGYESTIPVTMDDMVHHCKAVTRARPRALVVGDMPWLSYHVSREDSVANAGRLVQEGAVGAVKVEGGYKRLPMIEAMLDTEIPVMGHLGLTPQSVHAMGGYRVQGKEAAGAEALVADAAALDEAGVFAIVLEGVPDALAKLITAEISAPTIGIGAGPHCDGQVLVFHDVVGLGDGPDPKFVRRYADLGAAATNALERFFADVESGAFPGDGESYHMTEEAVAELYGRRRSPGS